MKFTFEQTAEDYEDLSSHSLKSSKFIRYLGVGLILCLIILLLQNVGAGNDIAVFLLSWLIPIGLFLVFFYFFYRFSLKRAMNNPENQDVLFGKREIELTDVGIKVISPATTGEYKWAAIIKMEESTKSYFLYIASKQAIIIPKRIASTPAEEAELEQLLRSNIPS